jgi:hypothetical protein
MRWLCNFRTARLVAALLTVVTITGCPELNQWSGPNQDPFFSVADPVPENSGRSESESASASKARSRSTGWRAAR